VSKAILLYLAVVFQCSAQYEAFPLHGEIRTTYNLMGNRLQVEILEEAGHRLVDRTHVSNDGIFEFRHVPRGRYEVRLCTETGDVLDRATADVNQSNMMPVTLRLNGTPAAQPSGGTVSVGRLRHVPPRKAVQALASAQRYAAHGDFSIAAGELRKALKLDPGFAEAHANLGVALIRNRQVAEAEREFRQALELDPGTATHYSNLAFSLMALGRFPEAEPFAKRAVEMEGSNLRAHCVLGYLLARQPAQREAAIHHLQIAARAMPEADRLAKQLMKYGSDQPLPTVAAQ
jgi:tetratricopeptide (TPR) repeat protein